MQELNNTSPFSLDHLVAADIFSHPEYLAGFNDGLDAYEENCENEGCLLSGHEVCKTIKDELDPSPRVRFNVEMAARLHGIQPDPWFISGFLAGWIFAHLHLSVTPDAPALPNTQPLGVPFPPGASSHAPEASSEEVRERVNIVMSLPARFCGIDGEPLDL